MSSPRLPLRHWGRGVLGPWNWLRIWAGVLLQRPVNHVRLSSSASVADVAVQRGNAVAVKRTRADDVGSHYDIA